MSPTAPKSTKNNTGPQLGTGEVGKADYRRAILAGFGTEDTHHIVHAFRWGPDGRLYFNQSIYIHSTLETPSGTSASPGASGDSPVDDVISVFVTAWCTIGRRLDLLGQRLRHRRRSLRNQLFRSRCGVHGDAQRQAGPSGLTPSPACRRNPQRLADASMRHFITNDFANQISSFKLSDAGAGYSAKIQLDFLTSSDKAFRPIDVKMGPDGALYIADWYNPIINHGEVDFRDPRRDHVHGRIWRVTAKGRPLVERPKLVGAPAKALLDHLLDPENWARLQARLESACDRGAAEVAPERPMAGTCRVAA